MEGLPKKMICDASARPLRIAILYSRIPFPMMRGDQLTVSHLISFLSARGHSIDFFTLGVQGAMSSDQSAWLNQNCRSVRIYEHPKWRQAIGGLTGLMRLLPLQVGIFQNGQLKRDVEAAVAGGRYDIVYAYYIRSAPAVPWHILSGAPLGGAAPGNGVAFLAMQLSQTLNSRRIFENSRSILKRGFYWLEKRLCARYESRIWQKFAKTVLIGPADVEAVEQVCREERQPQINNWIYGAHGTDTDRFIPAVEADIVAGRVVFSGSMLYQPNIQAVLWFVENCWPVIKRAFPDAEFIVQGRDPVAEILALHGQDGIVVTGTVPDVGTIIRSAAVCVNPMLAAGGMQNKLIEYMACGKAVVATSVANEGIQAPSGSLIIADSSDEFSDEVIRLLGDSALATRLGQSARSYTLANWTWESHFLKLEAAFHAASST